MDSPLPNQPVRGETDNFDGFDVGHCFISLSKYNEDGTVTTVTYGFYPRGFGLNSPGQLGNDSEHEYDIAVGKMLSEEQFKAVLSTTDRYAEKRYIVRASNCSNFSRDASFAAGLILPGGDCANNATCAPGEMGEDIRDNADLLVKKGAHVRITEGGNATYAPATNAPVTNDENCEE